jgi:two-component system, OmpR family, alkaline phosphatase synthesis response regulator PhoP
MEGGVDPRTILLVHAGMDVRRIYRAALEHAGYRVLDTSDGDDAMQLLAANDCFAVITDLFIDSECDDQCFLRRVRRDPRSGSLPVLVVTAWTTDSYRDIALQGGATEFLGLPTLPRELVAKVGQYVPEATRSAAS